MAAAAGAAAGSRCAWGRQAASPQPQPATKPRAHLRQVLAVLALRPQAHQQQPDVQADGGVHLLELLRDAHGCRQEKWRPRRRSRSWLEQAVKKRGMAACSYHTAIPDRGSSTGCPVPIPRPAVLTYKHAAGCFGAGRRGPAREAAAAGRQRLWSSGTHPAGRRVPPPARSRPCTAAAPRACACSRENSSRPG